MDVLGWLSDTERHTAIVGAAIALLALVAGGAEFWPRLRLRLVRRDAALAFCATMLLTLVAARWPTFFVRHRLNPDEAQMTAQAIMALHHPRPWLDFDSGSSGPLNSYVLMWPALLGGHVTFFTTRMVAVALEWIALVGAYFAIAQFDVVIARVAVLPALAFFANSVEDDFVHYSSEHLPLAIASVMTALLARGACRGFSWRPLAWIGLLAGALPFTKLQSAPLGLAIVLATLGCVAAARSLSVRRRALLALVTVGCCAAIPALFVCEFLATGSFGDFWTSYILGALAYIGYDYMPLSFLTATNEFGPYFLTMATTIGVGAIVLAIAWRALPGRIRAAFFVAAVIGAGAIYAVYSPRHGSPHYVLFAVIPLATLAAAALAIVGQVTTRSLRATALAGFLVVAFAQQSVFVRPYYNWIGAYAESKTAEPFDPIDGEIERYLRPGERLAIWGWVPEYWVYSQTLLGTRDSVSVFQYTPYFNPNRAYFRARYLKDFAANRPPGFLDGGSESFQFDGTMRYLSDDFPDLAKTIARDYTCVVEWKRFRFFIARDRFDARDATAIANHGSCAKTRL